MTSRMISALLLSILCVEASAQLAPVYTPGGAPPSSNKARNEVPRSEARAINASRPRRNRFVTETVYGFLDFTTTVGSTVMVFTPQSEKEIEPSPSSTSVAVITASPTIEKLVATKAPEVKEKRVIVATSISSSTSAPSGLAKLLKEALLVKKEAPFSFTSRPLRNSYKKAELPINKHRDIIPTNKLKNSSGGSTIVPIIIEGKGGSLSPKAPLLESSIYIPEEIVVSATQNFPPVSLIGPFNTEVDNAIENSDRDDYFASETTPSISVEYPKDNLKSSAAKPTGLITTLGGTIVSDGQTTIHKTSVIGTYVSGKYAQVLKSTSKIFQDNPSENLITPTQNMYETVSEVIEGSATQFFKPEITASLPIESLFSSSIFRAPRYETIYDDDISETESKLTKRKGTNPYTRDDYYYYDSKDQYYYEDYEDLVRAGSGFRDTVNPPPQNPVRPPPQNPVRPPPQNPVRPPPHNPVRPPTRNPIRPPSSSPGRQSTHKLINSPSKYKPSNPPKQISPSKPTFRRKPEPSTFRPFYKSTGTRNIPPSFLRNSPPPEKNRKTFNRFQLTSNRPKIKVNRKQSSTLTTEDRIQPEPTVKYPSATNSKGTIEETVHVTTSIPSDGPTDVWYELITLRSLHTFRSGTTKSTRYVTYTETNTHSIEPTSTMELGSSEKTILYKEAPLFENILDDKKNEIATLPPINIDGKNLHDLLKTTTETFRTTETMYKTSVLPVKESEKLYQHTLTQTYLITRIVSAIKTIPPVDAFEFIPSDSLNEFNTKLLAEGTENEAALLPGELEYDENKETRVAPPPGFKLSDSNLADLAGGKFSPEALEKQMNPQLAAAIQNGGTHQLSGTKQSLPSSAPAATPQLSPEALQMAYLRLMNPYMFGAFPGAQTQQATVTSSPVIITTHVTTTSTRVLRVIFNARPILTTISSTGVIKTTITSYFTSTVAAQPLGRMPFGFPGGLPFAAG